MPKPGYNIFLHNILQENYARVLSNTKLSKDSIKKSHATIRKTEKQRKRWINALNYFHYLFLGFAVVALVLPSSCFFVVNKSDLNSILMGCITVLVLGSLVITLVQQPTTELAKLGPGFGIAIFRIKEIKKIGWWSALSTTLVIIVSVLNLSPNLSYSMAALTVSVLFKYWQTFYLVIFKMDSYEISEIIKRDISLGYEEIVKTTDKLSEKLETNNIDITFDQRNCIVFPYLISKLEGVRRASNLDKDTEAFAIWDGISDSLKNLGKINDGNFGLSSNYLPEFLLATRNVITKLRHNGDVRLIQKLFFDLVELLAIDSKSEMSSYARLNLLQFVLNNTKAGNSEDWEFQFIAINSLRKATLNLIQIEAYEDASIIDVQLRELYLKAIEDNSIYILEELVVFAVMRLDNYSKVDSKFARFLVQNWVNSIADGIFLDIQTRKFGLLRTSQRIIPGISLDENSLSSLIYKADSTAYFVNIDYAVYKLTDYLLQRVPSIFQKEDRAFQLLEEIMRPSIALRYKILLSNYDIKPLSGDLDNVCVWLESLPSDIRNLILNDTSFVTSFWTLLILDLISLPTREIRQTRLLEISQLVENLGEKSRLSTLIECFKLNEYIGERRVFSRGEHLEARLQRKGLRSVSSAFLQEYSQSIDMLNEWILNFHEE
ncbi:MAG: hypothetical protein RL129_111 [Actinomycetota bacterium]|jgi:hypothetical protein